MIKAKAGRSALVQILKSSQDRDRKLVRLKLKRMSDSAFAFFRGACGIFAGDWNGDKPRGEGPSLLVCGDLHLENFGAYRDDEGEFLYDINDFDEALIAPCSVDPVRCATSIFLASELWALSPLQANRLVLSYLDEYRSVLTSPGHGRQVDAEAPRLSRGPIWEILGKTALGTQEQLLDQNTERHKHGTRRIVRGKRKHPELERDERELVLAAVESYGKAKNRPEFFDPIDATGRVAGIGSLGVKRYLVLVAGGGSAETNQLLDVKQELPSAWLPHTGTTAKGSNASEAARVVYAQSTLQARPSAGLDTLPVGDEEYRVREMIPEENRSSLDRFQHKPTKLRQAIVEAGRLTGLAHLRAARTVEDRDVASEMAEWANGPALDSLLASATRFAERTRLAYKQFCADRRSPDALPEALKEQAGG